MATQDSRIKIKRSTVTATVPTVPSSNDHTDGTWIATDIYKGELFFNQADGVLWSRDDSGVICLGGSASLTIASADVLTLNTTPLTIVPAAGVGTFIELISASVYIDFNTTPYATDKSLYLFQDTATESMASNSNALGATSTVLSGFIKEEGANSLENTPVKVKSLTTDPTAGDSDITVFVKYRIILV